MVSEKILKKMRAFIKKYDGLEIKNDNEATFDFETDIAWFANYQYNLDDNNDGYTDEIVIDIINYWTKYLKNKKLVKSKFWTKIEDDWKKIEEK